MVKKKENIQVQKSLEKLKNILQNLELNFKKKKIIYKFSWIINLLNKLYNVKYNFNYCYI